MEKFKRNKLFPSFSSQSTNKFRNIKNSPNFGNQQILLQSCCFFDSERSQTPHASHTLIKEFKVGNKNKYGGSPKVSYSNGNIGSFKKFHFLTSNINERNNNYNIKSTNSEELAIVKLKKDNKALKQTIKNLTTQLDRVCNIALKAKNNEMNTIQKNNDSEQEKNNLLNKIENLTKEKNDLKNEIEKKNEEYNNYKLKNKINEINNKNIIIDNEKKRRKFITEITSEFENIKQMNNSLSISVNKEMNENKQYKLTINKLTEENELLKNKIEEQINILNEKLNEKDKNIQNLLKENLALKTNFNINEKIFSENKKIKSLDNENEQNKLKKENINLTNKL